MAATTLRDVIFNTLDNDATLTTLLPGGFLDSEILPHDGGGMNVAPKTADGITINPFGVIRWKASNAFGPETIAAELQQLEVYVYADVGYATLETAIGRIKALLNRTYPAGVSDRGLAFLQFMHASPELTAEEFNNAPMMFIRFAIYQVR